MENQIKDLLKNLKIEDGSNYKCIKCKDTGYIIKKGVAYTCSCVKNKSKLPLKLEKIYLKDFNLKYYPDEIISPEKSKETYYDKANYLLKAAKSFVEDLVADKKEVKGLLIIGPVGSGKTHLVAGIYNELIRKNKDVKFFVVPDLLEQGKIDIFSDSNNKDIINKAKNAEILILDDLGAHNYTPWTINQLYSLLNYRLNNLLTTVITTNLDIEEIEDCLDKRIASRIFELCKGYTLKVDADIRYKKNIKKK